MSSDVRARTVFNDEVIASNASSTSTTIELNSYKPSGYFSLQANLTGSGTLKFRYLLSNDNIYFRCPVSEPDIVTAHHATSGRGKDGIELYPLDPPVAKYMKIRAIETAGSQATITANLAIS